MSNFNFGDQIAQQVASAATFSPNDPKVKLQMTRVEDSYRKVVSDGPEYADPATGRIEFLRKLMNGQPITNDARESARQQSESLVAGQKKICPILRKKQVVPGSTVTKPPAAVKAPTPSSTTAP